MTKIKPYKCSRALEQQLLRWALSGEVGASSRYMAGVAAFGRNYKLTFSALPRDYDDLRRCVRMAAACKSFRQALPELARVSPCWGRFVKRWEELQKLVANDYPASHTAYSIYAALRNQIETPQTNE
jgi:hypothetical protein